MQYHAVMWLQITQAAATAIALVVLVPWAWNRWRFRRIPGAYAAAALHSGNLHAAHAALGLGIIILSLRQHWRLPYDRARVAVAWPAQH